MKKVRLMTETLIDLMATVALVIEISVIMMVSILMILIIASSVVSDVTMNAIHRPSHASTFTAVPTVMYEREGAESGLCREKQFRPTKKDSNTLIIRTEAIIHALFFFKLIWQIMLQEDI